MNEYPRWTCKFHLFSEKNEKKVSSGGATFAHAFRGIGFRSCHFDAKSDRIGILSHERLDRVAVAPKYVAPAFCDLGALLVAELIFIGLVTLDARQVFLQPRQQRIEAAELEVIVDLLHLADRIDDQVFIAHLIELSRAEQFLAFFEPIVQMREG